MSRVVVNPYGASKSAKELATYIGVKRLLTNGRSKFIVRQEDVVINWGIGKSNIGRARQINKLENVQLASNKLQTFEALENAGVSIPATYRDGDELPDEMIFVARTKLHGHSGDGIIIYNPEEDDKPRAPLYVEYIPKVAEYRAIVVGNEVVDFKKKKKRNTPSTPEEREALGLSPQGEERLEYDEHVWNLNGNYIFARNGFDVPPSASQLSIDSINALGLDFGAVDIIEDESGTLYVLEVNTAFGLEGSTIELVGDAIGRLI